MNKINTHFVVSMYDSSNINASMELNSSQVNWVLDYTDKYTIYDKSNSLKQNNQILKINNVGHNIHDIVHYIYTNYHNLPKTVAFLEGYPWDHCNRKKFDRLINHTFFTPLESYENVEQTAAQIFCSDSGFMERNNSWYIQDTISKRKTASKFSSYNQFLGTIFKNIVLTQWVRFAPGGMYIVERERLKYYSQDFWKKLLSLVDKSQWHPEAYIIERALWTIFSCCYEEVDL